MSERTSSVERLQVWMDELQTDMRQYGVRESEEFFNFITRFYMTAEEMMGTSDNLRIVLANPGTEQMERLFTNGSVSEAESKLMSQYMVYEAFRKGLDVYVFSDQDKIPYKCVPDDSVYQCSFEYASKPVAPEKPGFWKNLANKLTFGRAYHEEIETYKEQLREYNDKYASDDAARKAEEAYKRAQAAVALFEDDVEIENVDVVREEQPAMEAVKQEVGISEEYRKEIARIRTENYIGKTAYEKLFMPIDEEREYPIGFNAEAVATLVFACALENGAPADLHWLTSDEHSLNLADIAASSREKADELMEKYEQGDYEPMSRMISNAMISVVQHWNAGAAQTPADVAVYASVLEGLSTHMVDSRLLEEGSPLNDLPDEVRVQMDAIIAINRLQRDDISAVSDLMSVNYDESTLEQRNTALVDVIAKRMFDKDLKDQQKAMTKPLQDELGMRVQSNSEKMSWALKHYNEQLKDRPQLPLERQILEDSGAVYSEYREKARQSSIYRELSQITDQEQFKRRIFDLSSGKMAAQLAREPIGVDELGGRAQQPQRTNERVSTRTMTHETQRQMHN